MKLRVMAQRLAMGVATGLTAQLLCAMWSWVRRPALPESRDPHAEPRA